MDFKSLKINHEAKTIDVAWDNNGIEHCAVYTGLQRNDFLADIPDGQAAAEECWPNWRREDYLPPSRPLPTAAEQLERIRLERNARLSASDWAVLPDSPVIDKAAWLAYRQGLRDFPATCDPASPVWPEMPG